MVVEENPLLPLPQGMQIDQLQEVENEVSITVIATHLTSSCPLCRQPSSSIHSRYRRTVRDAPCAGRRIRLILCVRKFFCRNRLCERKIFTEQFPNLVRPWAKMTIRYSEQITSIGLATSGQAGTRLAARLGVKTTRQTVLRHIMALPNSPVESILYLGIDDFSFRRGCRFGTILVNLESRRVVDLLPNREAETAAAWMRQQVDLLAVSRDRGGEYASAAAQGAPQTIQCADRFHLLKNLREDLEGLLAHHLATARHQETKTIEEQVPVWPSKRVTRTSPQLERLQQSRREERLTRYEQVITLRKQGLGCQAIANRVGMGASTVQSWLAAGRFPERKPREQTSQLDPYLPHLTQRWEDGCHNIARLFRELVEQGYKGSYESVRDRLVHLLPNGRKKATASSLQTPALPNARQAAYLFLRRTER